MARDSPHEEKVGQGANPTPRLSQSAMTRSAILLLILLTALAACSNAEQKAKFFPLHEIEAEIDQEAPVVLPPSGSNWKSRVVQMRVSFPKEFAGMSLVIRFKDGDDANCRILCVPEGGRFKLNAPEGEGLVSGNVIHFVPGSGSKVTRL